MAITNSKVYQFHVSLKGPKPKIWRRVQVPENYTFWNLHVAIQNLMPWRDYHLHQFSVKNPVTGAKDLIGTLDPMMGVSVDEREAKLKDYFHAPKDKGTYVYDFGLDWLHEVIFEKSLDAATGVKYPRCVSGKNTCFPEDNVDDRPEGEFNPEDVDFEDPEEHWNSWFGANHH